MVSQPLNNKSEYAGRHASKVTYMASASVHIHEVQTKVTQLQSMVELMVNSSLCNIFMLSKRHFHDML